MKKNTVLLLISIALSCFTFAKAQTPGIKWSKKITPIWPTHPYEFIYDVKPTSDKGFILVGADTTYSFSNTYGILEKTYGQRSWIVKTDSSGLVLWRSSSYSLSLYGNVFSSVEQTKDAGYIAVGNIDTAKLLIAKFNGAGLLQWTKTFGINGVNYAQCIHKTKTNGFIIIGTTSATSGDVIGNHGGNDIWALRIDENGNIIWSKCFGGTGNETGQSVIQTADYGFIFTGSATSTNGDLVSNNGGMDAWLFKTDSSGNLLWQKNYGTPGKETFRSVTIAPDNTIVLTGNVDSTNLINNGLKGGENLWTVKTDMFGNIIWSEVFGGSKDERGYHISALPNNSLLVTGYTNSNDLDVIGSNGGADIWVLNLTPSGTLNWSKCIGTIRKEYGFAGLYLSENDFVVAGTADSSSFSQSDGYLARLGNSNTIKTNIFYDANANSIKDAGEINYNNVTIKIENGSEIYLAQPNNGLAKIEVGLGSYITTVQPLNPYVTIIPSARNSSFSSYFNTDSFNFAIQPIPNKQDIMVQLLPVSPARPGFKAQYILNYKNIGTTTIDNGSVKLLKDSRTVYSLAFPLPSSVISDTIIWNFINLKPLDSIAIGIELQLPLPPVLNNNDTLKLKAFISPVVNDLTPSDDTSILKQVVTGSYDPNDKQENYAGTIPIQDVNNGSFINYFIRFQNTGNDTAFVVRLADTLDANLDWPSFQMIGSSHAYNLSIKDGNKLMWTFDNIKLVDSFHNELLSHGFIAFKIKPKNTLTTNSQIKNTAAIYFDYNLPVITNTTVTTIVENSMTTAVLNISKPKIKLTVSPNPSSNHIVVSIGGDIYGSFELSLTDNNGRVLFSKKVNKPADTNVSVPVDLKNLSSGIYYIRVRQKQLSWAEKIVIQ